jgi:hypothetical protein
MVESVFQDDEYGCGAACLAMFASISYKAARHRLFGASGPTTAGISKGPLLTALRDYGLKIGRSNRVIAGSLPKLRADALLMCRLLPSRGKIEAGENTYAHWMVWDAEQMTVRDPYRFSKPFWITSYTLVRGR